MDPTGRNSKKTGKLRILRRKVSFINMGLMPFNHRQVLISSGSKDNRATSDVMLPPVTPDYLTVAFAKAANVNKAFSGIYFKKTQLPAKSSAAGKARNRHSKSGVDSNENSRLGRMNTKDKGENIHLDLSDLSFHEKRIEEEGYKYAMVSVERHKLVVADKTFENPNKSMQSILTGLDFSNFDMDTRRSSVASKRGNIAGGLNKIAKRFSKARGKTGRRASASAKQNAAVNNRTMFMEHIMMGAKGLSLRSERHRVFLSDLVGISSTVDEDELEFHIDFKHSKSSTGRLEAPSNDFQIERISFRVIEARALNKLKELRTAIKAAMASLAEVCKSYHAIIMEKDSAEVGNGKFLSIAKQRVDLSILGNGYKSTETADAMEDLAKLLKRGKQVTSVDWMEKAQEIRKRLEADELLKDDEVMSLHSF